VSRSYPTPKGMHKVLDDVSIKFTKGNSTGILGLNGAGKSTLIRIIGGAEQPDSGKIIRNARVSWPVGFGGGFNGSLTGRENLRFVSRIYGADLKKVSAYVEEFTELGKYMDMPIKTYSSGMRSKLAFGLSLAINFDFYLIDEAFSVGDATFVKKATEEINKLKERATLIFVSHSINSVKKHCQSGAVLYKGKLTYFSNLDEAIKVYTEICNVKR
jgi:capsular polysaccharide transport system ATP-binding protein